MADRALLQQALDALQSAYGWQATTPQLNAAITALREALAADHFRDVAEKVAPAAPVPDGWVMAPNYRGYVAFGTGQYLLDISAEANPAELIIHVATDAEKEGRTVGDLRDKPNPGEVIQPEKMAVRLAFFTVAGLDALEQQLRLLRKEHFASSPAAPVVREPQPLTQAAFDVLAERHRQVDAEGWTPEHDDQHNDGSMALAASVYALIGSSDGRHRGDNGQTPSITEILWPWNWSWLKPKSRRSNLIRAAALLLAEIERLDRKSGIGTTGGSK